MFDFNDGFVAFNITVFIERPSHIFIHVPTSQKQTKKNKQHNLQQGNFDHRKQLNITNFDKLLRREIRYVVLHFIQPLYIRDTMPRSVVSLVSFRRVIKISKTTTCEEKLCGGALT